MRIHVDGIAQIARDLDALDPVAGRGWIRGALKEAGKAVVEKARAEIRTGGGRAVLGRLTERTGRLRKSMQTYDKNLPKWIEVGTPYVYGWFHERKGYPGPRPFLAPALEAAKDEIQAIVLEHASAAAQKVRGGA